MPVIICTVPSLDINYNGDYSLEKAARSVFLTLNKTARPVSGARNLLLDDNDLISFFMRSVLSEIKDSSDQRSDHFLNINNIDLDEEKQKLNNPIAISSVKSLYYTIEHLVLSTVESTVGLGDRKGKFGNRSDFETGLEKLNGHNDLLQEQYDSLSRFHFSSESADILNKNFMLFYGKFIIKFYKQFLPFRVYSEATLQLKGNIKRSDDTHINSMIFNGQGEINVFEEYMKDLSDRKDKLSLKHLPRIEKVLKDLNDTKKRLDSRIQELYSIRSEYYLRDNKDKSKLTDGTAIKDVVHRTIKQLYNDVFSSQAFQASLICTFFGEVEACAIDNKTDDSSIETLLVEYLSQINEFFYPKSLVSFKRIINLFIGEMQFNESNGDIKILHNSNTTFGQIVSLNEMKPNSWPKYRYIMLEIWSSSNEILNKRIAEQLEICRQDVSKQLFNKFKDNYSKEHRRHENELSEDDIKHILEIAYKDYNDFLKNLGRSSTLNESIFKKYVRS
ncbi:hypothetical protein [Thiothrix winogradskyi]|uniref:Uncharacterized protein n=1 Tax=Thiothrix winogradskyi TaxID=96472 RepID=A0ABY3T2M8_9GAMM|nr:hypothetical protein [Thiothrix winogradskyi]UJS25029.1 hypothetical protein L2Y54_03060 [Thiothrix winogradskyi]